MSCYRSRRRLGAFLDGELGGRQSRFISAHLTACPRCRLEANQLRRVRAVMRSAFHARSVNEPDWTGFWPGIVRGIERARSAPAPAIRSRAALRRWAPRLAWGGAVAAALVGSLTAWDALHPTRLTTPGIVVSAADTESSDGTIMVYSPPERDLAIVWVFEGD